jgi:hypothetical protein
MRKLFSKYDFIFEAFKRLADLQCRSHETNVVIFLILLLLAGVGFLYAAAIL